MMTALSGAQDDKEEQKRCGGSSVIEGRGLGLGGRRCGEVPCWKRDRKEV